MSRPASCSPCDHFGAVEKASPQRAEGLGGINCLDVGREEVAIAALEMLSEQSHSQPSYRILNYNYKVETEAQEEASTR